MPFIIAPLEDVKGLNNYPEYIAALRAVQDAAISRGQQTWGNSQVAGGLIPRDKQFGVGPFRKNDMAGDTTDSTPSGSYTFRINYTTTGWRDIFRYTVRNDMIHAFAGFLITDNGLNIMQLRLEIGSRLFPIWDIQEAQRYDKFAIILKTDQGAELVAEPKTRILLRGYVEATGIQRVVPLGLQLFRVADSVLTET